MLVDNAQQSSCPFGFLLCILGTKIRPKGTTCFVNGIKLFTARPLYRSLAPTKGKLHFYTIKFLL